MLSSKENIRPAYIKVREAIAVNTENPALHAASLLKSFRNVFSIAILQGGGIGYQLLRPGDRESRLQHITREQLLDQALMAHT